jgi:hypothetical protein
LRYLHHHLHHLGKEYNHGKTTEDAALPYLLFGMFGGDVVLAFKLAGVRDLGVGARFHC